MRDCATLDHLPRCLSISIPRLGSIFVANATNMQTILRIQESRPKPIVGFVLGWPNNFLITVMICGALRPQTLRTDTLFGAALQPLVQSTARLYRALPAARFPSCRKPRCACFATSVVAFHLHGAVTASWMRSIPLRNGITRMSLALMWESRC